MVAYSPKIAWAVADKTVVSELLRAADDFGADRMELVALFEAAIVESGVQALAPARGLVGALQQGSSWGPKAERLDPYTSALAFLREARRIRKQFLRPSRLAQGVQRSSYASRRRYGQAFRAAKLIIAQGRAAKHRKPPTRRLPIGPKPPPVVVTRLSERAEKALAWHRRESARPTRNRRNECLRTVRISLGVTHTTDWAIHAWLRVPQVEQHTSSVPPAGVPFFFRGTSKYGHIVLVDTPGKTINSTLVWSTDIKRSGKVDLVTIGEIKSKWSMKGLGWSNTLNGERLD